MGATRTTTLDDATAISRPHWLLTVVHHPDPARLGRRVAGPVGEALTLGRDAPGVDDIFDDTSVSRRHARVEGGELALRVTDLESHNGTWHGDARVSEAALTSGDVLRVGAVALLARRVERVPAVQRDAGFPAFSEAMARVAAALGDIAEGARAVVLSGPPFAGVDAVASALAARAPGALPILTLPVAAPDAASRETLFERATGRTVLVGPLPFADSAWQDVLVTLTARACAPRLMVLWWPASADDTDGSLARDALARSLDARVIELPPLRARGEDLPHLVRDLALRRHGRASRLHHGLVTAMLRARWPDDLRDLAAFVHEHLTPSAEGDALARSPAIEASLGVTPEPLAPAAPAVASSGARVTLIARDAQWFQAPGESAVSLSGRFALARVLRALVEALVERPGRGTDVESIVRAAWSGQRPVGDSGAHRAYVAVSTLRRMGLADALTRNEEGYLLDPRVTVVADAPFV